MNKFWRRFSCILIIGFLAGFLFVYPAVSGSKTTKTIVSEGPVEQVNPYYGKQDVILSDGTRLTKHMITGPSKPPAGYELDRASVSLPAPIKTLAANTLTVPAYNWVFGCSAVSGAMIHGYYDRNGFPDMYTGPCNSGVAPLDNSSCWGAWSDGVDTYPDNPLIASHKGIDGRVAKGSVDDYWVQYGSGADDPYITGSWTQHAGSDGFAIGDYMYTSQSACGNTDGSTTFWSYTISANQLSCDDLPESSGYYDGTVGRKNFYEARGYTVTNCYNQKTDNKVAGGFSFAQFKAEIDAGRPVLLNLAGHSIVGVGYNDTGNTVYIHDTWDHTSHSMTWGGSYAGMELLTVSIVNPVSTTTTDMNITISGSPSSVIMGGTITYSIAVSNNGPVATTTTTVTDHLSAYVSFLSATPSQGSCSGTSTVTCNLGAMNSGAAATISLVVTAVTPITSLTNTVNISSNLTDSNLSNNTATSNGTVINYPMPVINSLDPATKVEGTGSFTLIINGSNFNNGSNVLWNGELRDRDYNSSSKLTVYIHSGDISSDGTAIVTVTNPAPGGGVSNEAIFTISNASAPFGVAGGDGGGGGGCFIATAAFGAPFEKHVRILRQFRDHCLLTTSPGRAFVKFYYEFSPPIAARIAGSEGLRFVTRCGLMPLVGVAYLTLTYGAMTVLLMALSLLLMAGAAFFMIRRKVWTFKP